MIGNDKKNDKKNDKEIDKNGLPEVSFLSINSDGNLRFLASSLKVENLFSSDFYVTVIDENEEIESYENGKRVNASNENLNNKNNNNSNNKNNNDNNSKDNNDNNDMNINIYNSNDNNNDNNNNDNNNESNSYSNNNSNNNNDSTNDNDDESYKIKEIKVIGEDSLKMFHEEGYLKIPNVIPKNRIIACLR